ncbi:YcaO-like family protein [Pseudomonas sp. NPDC087358]|jgi:ribosomal protein S12 methylthiotransferase accessory factor|uniref:YcaO-like family protein n=1 Tax=Pseudomonas sp. NPDC087358 TaxID=3364439 RepID=UPI00384E0E71
MYRMTSSLRKASLSDTLVHARQLAVQFGITRVTNTTWLDKIGIPVFASIRPDAVEGSLCVSAGKGMHAAEAQVGAYMEAIEFAIAEYRNRNIDVFLSTPRKIAAQTDFVYDFVDFCPLLGKAIDPDGPLACVHGHDIATGQTFAVPAELIFSPFSENPGQRIFGTSTNGLCSGNTVEEASVHGIAEIVERDVQAFNFMKNTSRLVRRDCAIETLDPLFERVEQSGLKAVLRYTPSVIKLPYFQGFIMEPSDNAPIAISCGSGLHLCRDIAAVRGLAEAAQSRLSYIHGGRDDLIERFKYFSVDGRQAELEAVARLRHDVNDTHQAVDYSSIEDANHKIHSIDSALECLLERLRNNGFSQVLRVVLSKKDSPLAVVKIVIPGMESFQPALKRAGRRLSRYIASEGGEP